MNSMYLNIPDFSSIKIDPKLKWDVDIAKLKNPGSHVLSRSTSFVPEDKKKYERQENNEKALKINAHNTSNVILRKINENFRYKPIGSLGKQKHLSYGRNGSLTGNGQGPDTPEPDSGSHYYDADHPVNPFSQVRHRGAVMFDQDYLLEQVHNDNPSYNRVKFMSPQPKHALNSYLTDSPQKPAPPNFREKPTKRVKNSRTAPNHRPSQSCSQNSPQDDLHPTTTPPPPTTTQERFLTSLPQIQSRFSTTNSSPLAPNNISYTERILREPLESMLSTPHHDFLDYKDKHYIINMKKFHEKIPSKNPELDRLKVVGAPTGNLRDCIRFMEGKQPELAYYKN